MRQPAATRRSTRLFEENNHGIRQYLRGAPSKRPRSSGRREKIRAVFFHEISFDAFERFDFSLFDRHSSLAYFSRFRLRSAGVAAARSRDPSRFDVSHFAIILLVLASFEFLFLIYMTSFPLLRSLLRWIASLLLSIG